MYATRSPWPMPMSSCSTCDQRSQRSKNCAYVSLRSPSTTASRFAYNRRARRAKSRGVSASSISYLPSIRAPGVSATLIPRMLYPASTSRIWPVTFRASGPVHERRGAVGHGDQRIRADVQGAAKIRPTRRREGLLERLRRREGDAVDQDVQTSPGPVHSFEDRVEIRVLRHIRWYDQRAIDRCGQVAHALLEALALEGERQLRAFAGQRLSDRPGDAASI